MAHHKIKITGSIPNRKHPNLSTLSLSDMGRTHVKAGDTVTWIIDVKEITSILIKDDNSSDLFHPDPAPVSPAKKDSAWSGKIKEGVKSGSEFYTICWSQGGETYCYDPVIQVNS
ncbi:MAG: hypothetical protein SH818_07765 [Saprospiraceae bacterium]|nr:hypothetical protein [Saprospiraceae bacterium]